jgi:hypothetical protein
MKHGQVLGKSIVRLGKSIVLLSMFRDVLGKSIVLLSVLRDVLGKLIVLLLVFPDVLGESIVPLSMFRDVLGKSIVLLPVFRDVLGKSIVPLSMLRDVLGKSIVLLSMFRDVLGKSIVLLSVLRDVLGKSIVRNDRLAQHRSAFLERLSAHRQTNDRLAETLCELRDDASLLAATRSALRPRVMSQLFRRFTEQGTPPAQFNRRSPCATALTGKRNEAAGPAPMLRAEPGSPREVRRTGSVLRTARTLPGTLLLRRRSSRAGSSGRPGP